MASFRRQWEEEEVAKGWEEASNKVGNKQESVVSWIPSEESVSTGREHSTG